MPEQENRAIVVGAGFAGAVAARQLAEGGYAVLLLEKRSHIAGNAYDAFDAQGILVHRYGPHIFHTHDQRVFSYLTRFTAWNGYEHEVRASIDGYLVPVPFNLNSVYLSFGQQRGRHIAELLTATFGVEQKIPVLELLGHPAREIQALADYVYHKVFLNYTIKQWGLSPEKVDKAVTARVPIRISWDNRYFQDPYQGLPTDGYTALIHQMLAHSGITLALEHDARTSLQVDLAGGGIRFAGQPFHGPVIYTGPVDELFDYQFGELPYRSLEFQSENYRLDHFQLTGVVNYPNDHQFTRISEYKHMTRQAAPGKTAIMKEFPQAYQREDPEMVPCYPIPAAENSAILQQYQRAASSIGNLHLLGRLAEYRYYNIDQVVANALKITEALTGAGEKKGREK